MSLRSFVLSICEWLFKTGFTVVLYFVDFIDKPLNASKTDTDPQDQQRRSAIQDTIVNKGGITFQDIAGLHEAKQALTEAIIMPLHFPQLFTGNALVKINHVFKCKTVNIFLSICFNMCFGCSKELSQ